MQRRLELALADSLVRLVHWCNVGQRLLRSAEVRLAERACRLYERALVRRAS